MMAVTAECEALAKLKAKPPLTLRESGDGDCNHCDVCPVSLLFQSCEPNLVTSVTAQPECQE